MYSFNCGLNVAQSNGIASMNCCCFFCLLFYIQVPRNMWASIPDSSLQNPSVGVSFHDDAVVWHSATHLPSGCWLPERNTETRAVWSRGARTFPWKIQRGAAQLLDHQCQFLVPQFGQGQIEMAAFSRLSSSLFAYNTSLFACNTCTVYNVLSQEICVQTGHRQWVLMGGGGSDQLQSTASVLIPSLLF